MILYPKRCILKNDEKSVKVILNKLRRELFMKYSVRTFLIVCLLMMLLLSLPALAASPISLRFMWWGGESRHKATMDVIQLYMKQNPNVVINGEYGGFSGYQQKLLTQLAGGTAADIIQIDQPWIADLMSQGDLFVNLYRAKGLNISEFDKGFLKNQCTWKKQLVGLPTGLNGLTYVANSAFLAKHHIDSNFKWNWDNLVEIGSKIHREAKNDYLLVIGGDQIRMMIKMYIKQHTGAKQWINDDFTPGFDQKSLSEALSYYKKLIQSGTVPPMEELILFEAKMENNPKWGAGELGISQDWVSTIDRYYLNGKVKLDTMLPPVLPKVKSPGIFVRPSQLLVINKKSAHVKEATKFVNWFFNDPKAILTLGTARGIPPTKIGLNTLERKNLLDSNVVKGLNLAVKNTGAPENALSNNKELLNIFTDYIQKVGFGKLEPAKAAELMLKDIRAKLAELKAQK
jgi:oligogalacturonide transport system substrate-binding protein